MAIALAKYKGIMGYGKITLEDIKRPDFCGYIFEINNAMHCFKINSSIEYKI